MKVLVHCQLDGHLSTIAKGYFQYYTHRQWQIVASGPFEQKNTHQAILAMKEDGLDLTNELPDALAIHADTDFNHIVVIGENHDDDFNDRPIPKTSLIAHAKLVELMKQLPAGSTGFYRAAQEIIKKEILHFIGKHQSQLTAKAAA